VTVSVARLYCRVTLGHSTRPAVALRRVTRGVVLRERGCHTFVDLRPRKPGERGSVGTKSTLWGVGMVVSLGLEVGSSMLVALVVGTYVDRLGLVWSIGRIVCGGGYGSACLGFVGCRGRRLGGGRLGGGNY
jgi:hypothetical protein